MQPAAAVPERAVLDDGPAWLRLRSRQWLLVALLGRELNLGRAAAAMGITQPAATRQLQELEATLSARLFDRTPRGMQPTPAGVVLLRHARRMLNDFSALRSELAAQSAGLQGRLRLGCVPSALPQLVTPVLAAFVAEHPRVQLALEVATSDLMLVKLAEAEVDLMVGRLTEGHHADEFETKPLLSEPQVVVARRAHPLARRRRPPTLLELAHSPWVVQPPGTPQAGRFLTMMSDAGVQHRLSLVETASTVATTALLEASDMLAVMPESLAAHYARTGVLCVLPLVLPLRVPDIHLVRRRAGPASPQAQAFVKALLAHAAAATGLGAAGSAVRVSRPHSSLGCPAA